MSTRELILGSGLSRLLVTAAPDGRVIVEAQALNERGRAAMGVVAALDRSMQHLLMLYLQERLDGTAKHN